MLAINVCYVLSLKMLCINDMDNKFLLKSKSICNCYMIHSFPTTFTSRGTQVPGIRMVIKNKRCFLCDHLDLTCIVDKKTTPFVVVYIPLLCSMITDKANAMIVSPDYDWV